ncbi:ribonucleases P/MRP protein subunit POP1-domain-containing protein [Cryomyces antarcticus]|uniref:Ribonucleases P/MRP protein subunit pop1 n=1 Tax=Cryomyces antarcticus TaxID=329879 RepID=A0ABR0LR40_9PEZI|nr:Ribonucleases P/MRP protein subunit pop1 [Cryomyces antarcticus]KAK5019686.1 Ribonucleases P/MRP protein subunit pop1 [Cryomyces antarcticus]KAK5202116.1 Ribonucleases P/MRP protein subunit pop1 [Cryomyces antarcticus]
MAPKPPPKSPASNRNTKRKQPSSTNNTAQRPRKRAKTHNDARKISTQLTSNAFKNGDLDVDKFVKSRDYEIRALEEGIGRAKKGLTQRAFQQVPRELRRRTASHNVKRVPTRLRGRASKEMREDNTPTVTARRRKPTAHMRLRLETVKRLRTLGSKRKAEKKAAAEFEAVLVTSDEAGAAQAVDSKGSSTSKHATVGTRIPRVKQATLKSPPLPPAKFRKRQVHKSWLPTHLYHAKRAHMTPPKEPLWRFAVPLTPTMKSYRPTHRASGTRGAVAWDMSYVSTIGLEGSEESIRKLLDDLRAGVNANGKAADLWEERGEKWRCGTRTWEGWLFEKDGWPTKAIAPATVVWCAKQRSHEQVEFETSATQKAAKKHKEKRKVLIRVHPSAFFQVWEEVVRLSKTQKTPITVEDLRFEIGSIEITGPGSTEALLGTLRPSTGPDYPQQGDDSPEAVWKSLTGVSNPASLPPNAIIAFTISDPRLHYPPRTVTIPPDPASQQKLLETLSNWPVDNTQPPAALFNRTARLTSSRSLPSQKAITRRRSLAAPGAYPSPLAEDPKIPVLLFTSRSPSPYHDPHFGKKAALSSRNQGTWTLLLPWKAVLPVWYSLMYYPLSSGGNVRLGGLMEKRQVCFEAGAPWFPGDFPGTAAGWSWEVKERKRRKEEWQKRPKGKRTEWTSVDLGVFNNERRRGELGDGWSCDWERLVNGPPKDLTTQDPEKATDGKAAACRREPPAKAPVSSAVHPFKLCHLPAPSASILLSSDPLTGEPDITHALTTVCITLLTRGVPTTCARIYRLPSNNDELRQQWLDLDPARPHNKNKNSARKATLPPKPAKDAPPHVQQQLLAASLLEPARAGEKAYPVAPDEVDLIGFVTTGNFNLGEGRGTGIGSILLFKVLEGRKDLAKKEGFQGSEYERGVQMAKREMRERFCIVREAGQGLGRLGRWALT